MTLRAPEPADWQRFFHLADDEGWRIPQIERQLFEGVWAHSALVLEERGRFCGLVTAVAHARSGWVGNLIVPADLRGYGYGSTLFKAALKMLQQQRLQTVWLTASVLGRPIYEKQGFVAIDRIERWVSPAGALRPRGIEVVSTSAAALLAADQSTWGENRQDFLDEIARGGQVYACGGATALLQQGPDLQIIGPWYIPSAGLSASRRLLQVLLSASDPKKEVVIDLLATSMVRPLLAEAGLECVGENLLMVHGEASWIARCQMAALASLGSVG